MSVVMKINEPGRISLIAIAAVGVALTFLFQDFSSLDSLGWSEATTFILRKVIRVVLNDFFMLLFMVAWFHDRNVTRLAVAIQVIDGLILLPIYLYWKLTVEGPSEISSPLLSQFHRMIVNPTLMILLIPAVYFQKISRKQE